MAERVAWATALLLGFAAMLRPARCSLAIAAAAIALGCSDEPAVAPANAPDQAQACAFGELESPDGSCLAPGIPQSACAAGFDADGSAGCVAMLPTQACPSGTMAVPGDDSCRSIASCAAPPWGDIPIDGATQYVDSSFFGASDGSNSAPWPTIQQAVAAATPDAVIAIAAGNYAEDVVLAGKAVRLWGVCPERVSIDGAGGIASLLLDSGASGSEVHNLAVTGSRFGVGVIGGQDTLLDGLWIHDTGDMGLLVETPSDRVTSTLRNSLIERARNAGARIFAASVVIEGSVIRDTSAGSGLGRGLLVRDESDVQLIGSLVEGNTDIGVWVSGSSAVIEGSVIRDTRSDADGLYGAGLYAVSASDSGLPSALLLTASVVERNASVGLLVESSDAVVERSVFRDMAPEPATGENGVGLQVQSTAGHPVVGTLTVRQSLVERTTAAGASSFGAELHAESIVVRDVRPLATGFFGRCVTGAFDGPLGRGSVISLSGSRLERCQETAAFAEGSALTIEHSALVDTRTPPSGVAGRGVIVQSHGPSGTGTQLLLRDSLVDGSFEAGVQIEGSEALLERSVVRNAKATEAAGLFGDGVLLTSELGFPRTVGELRDCVIESSARAGLTNFSADLAVAGSQLECNPIHMNGQQWAGAFSFENRGDNACGCAGEMVECKVLSAELSPPTPVLAQ
jgi:hypothetical protein